MNQPRTEIYLPCKADDIRRWAQNLTSENPIGESVDDYVELEAVDIYAGVELTFMFGDDPLHTLVVFGEPSDTELALELAADGAR